MTEDYKFHRFDAKYNNDSVIVYQAFNPAIAHFAAANNQFGGDFSFERTSWIKTSFLWMMYRSDWGQKKGQERILEISLDRIFFNKILQEAVLTKYDKENHDSEEEWKQEISLSDVILQFDSDRDLMNQKLERKAIQLGLRRKRLTQYALEEIDNIKDITDYVRAQHELLRSKDHDAIRLPEEYPYPVPTSTNLS